MQNNKIYQILIFLFAILLAGFKASFCQYRLSGVGLDSFKQGPIP